MVGPAGIGKSRLLQQVGDMAVQRGFVVRRGYGFSGSTSPLLLLQQLLADATSEQPNPCYPAADVAVSGRRVRTADRFPHARAASLAVSVDQAVFQVLQDVAQASRERPQVILLDDLEPADSESLRGIRLLARSTLQYGVVLVAAVRADARTWEDGRFGPGLLELRRAGVVRWVDLPPLSPSESAELVLRVVGNESGRAPPASQVSEIVRAAGGSPYLTVELARAWARSADSRLRRTAYSRDSSPRLAPSLSFNGFSPAARAVLLDRLLALGPKDLRLLSVAAQIGPEFWAEPIEVALELPPGEVEKRLALLAEGHWPISANGASPPSYSFDHRLLQEAVLTLPGIAQGRSVFRRLAHWWSAQRPNEPITAARLFGVAGDEAAALRAARRAVDSLLDQGALRGVADLVRWARVQRGLGRDPAVAARLGAYAADRLREMGEFYWVREVLADLATDVLSPSLRWRADFLRVESGLSRDLGAAEKLLESMRRSQGALAYRPISARRELLEFLGTLREAISGGPTSDRQYLHMQRTARALERCGRHLESCRLFSSRADLLSVVGEWEQARRACVEAQRLLPRVRRGRTFLGWLLRDVQSRVAFREGDVRQALTIARSQVESLLERGDMGRAARSLWQLAAFEYGLRQTEEARRHLLRATDLFSAFGTPEFVAAAHTLRGWTWIVDGEWTRAWEAFNDAVHSVSSESWVAERWGARVGLALVAAEAGDAQGARAALRVVEGKEPPSRSYATEYACVQARVLETTQELEAGRSVLIEAVKRTRGPATDLLELYHQLARWDELHGEPGSSQAWLTRIRALPEGLRQIAPEPWRGLGRYSAPPSLAKAVPTVGDSKGRSPYPVAPIRHRIVAMLQAAASVPGETRAPEGEFGLSEAEIARALETSRDSLSRAIRRLEEAGAIERTTRRPPGARRRVYVYRLRRPAT